WAMTSHQFWQSHLGVQGIPEISLLGNFLEKLNQTTSQQKPRKSDYPAPRQAPFEQKPHRHS
ncbi:MAG: hypothetical protein RPR40_11380, partial [Bermanella sp.]